MEKGAISKIIEYYSTKPKHRKEFITAVKEFFDRPDLKPGGDIELRDRDEEIFNEWFVFDFKLKNGKTLLEDFYDENPYNYNMIKLQIYKDLQDNCFGLYRVKDIQLGEWLKLENLKTGKTYQVREFSATFSLKKEQVFSGRVGRVGSHYELVGSNPVFGPVKINTELENIFKKEKGKLTPKFFRNNNSKLENNPFTDNYPSFEEAEDELNGILKKYALDSFVTTKTIEKWIYESFFDNKNNFGMNMLFSLVYPNIGEIEDVLKEIMNSYNIFYNLCPQKEMGNKSPFERIEEKEEKDIPSDIKMSLYKFPYSSVWGKDYKMALKNMERGDFKKGLKNINKVFEYMLENKISYPEIYRLYANKAACHFASREVKIGRYMLEIAHNLNPLYPLAKRQLKKAETGNFPNPKKREPDIYKDIGCQYYQFLKSLEINFIHTPKE